MLDFVLSDAQTLNAQLGVKDRQRLDAYMTGVREIETRLQETESESFVCGPELQQPDSTPQNSADYAELMLDIMVEAMRCDLTRVGTFMFGNGGSNRGHQEIGISEGHHELSHHQGDSSKLAKLAQIDAWEIEIFAHLLGRLRDSSGFEGSLLEETTLFFSSEIGDGDRHYHYNMPVVLGGRCGGLQAGRYLDLRGDQENNAPLANLFMRVLDDAGAGVERFGDDGDQSLEV